MKLYVTRDIPSGIHPTGESEFVKVWTKKPRLAPDYKWVGDTAGDAITVSVAELFDIPIPRMGEAVEIDVECSPIKTLRRRVVEAADRLHGLAVETYEDPVNKKILLERSREQKVVRNWIDELL